MLEEPASEVPNSGGWQIQLDLAAEEDLSAIVWNYFRALEQGCISLAIGSNKQEGGCTK